MDLKARQILIIDDDIDVLHSASMFLRQYFTEIVTEQDPTRIHSLISRNRFALVLLDMNFRRGEHDGKEGLYWLERIITVAPQTSVILITAYGDVELAVEAMRRGAADFVLKPWKNSRLLEAVRNVLARHQQQAAPPGKAMDPFSLEIVGDAPAMRSIYTLISKVAPTDANVLIMGENGTGKELIARQLHQQSLRRDGPFIKVDVGALTPTLFETEMFGHVKGAFTDAHQDKAGKFELAAGGTLLLDEIGNLSLSQQAKLLSVLQSRRVIRVGSNQEQMVNIRLVCATNMPLYEMVYESQEGAFRQDLLYRINTVEILVPRLQDRREDIPVLAQYFLQKYAEKYHKPKLHLSEGAVRQLQQHPWPGNVRELEHAVERATILCEGVVIEAHSLVLNSARHTAASVAGSTTLDENEKSFIRQVLHAHQGNVTQTAKALGITRTALYRRLDKYGL